MLIDAFPPSGPGDGTVSAATNCTVLPDRERTLSRMFIAVI